ncbi:GH3 auxin-responsive promoter family protein [Nibricoccus sp. IMCC34717]|uniref:GH3 family domain-containing protein n=1 Tax=Nibricoccus sp. IMCC34717 TaxID=3034021 RepID=UPI00384ED4FE
MISEISSSLYSDHFGKSALVFEIFSFSTAELDAELIARNDDYDAKRKGGGLCPPVVHVVPAGTFETWLRSKGKWGGQNKMPRCRGDRVIANDLATPAAAR